MRYRTPFTPAQRQDAVASYRGWRRFIARIRDDFRPVTPQQWDTVRELRRAVRDFGHAIQAVDAKVDVARLNALQEQANWLGVEYAILRNKPPEIDDRD